ncbi:DNA ligase D [Pseudomonas sp. 21LCFQ010]|uniref:DNA ligase D n=1 Tax=Pseudomonas sp. 21LCFQ010 TaxID=2957506 RepID=UPI0020968751|nr:DNA ligase D [Pseudomonas sp. 21LCFQ010]MCO8160688.1 DNA ligase D [Pseudomonas sp. 21LCFQ010]
MVSEYTRKRRFDITREPPETGTRSKRKAAGEALSFAIQKHDASHLHYDLRLELDGTLKSWAVPKGPSLDPAHKRLAVQVEDHPLAYASFEGRIPEGQYGAGEVIVWDRGIWQPHGDPRKGYEAGKLEFTLIGEKLNGEWALVRTRLKGSGNRKQWLLIKRSDDAARPVDEFDITVERPDSVLSDATLSRTRPARPEQPKKNTAFVHTLSPQLATLIDRPPPGDWLYEIKYDGYRILTCIHAGEVRLLSRTGNDWTARMPRLAKALARLGLEDSWLDGEVVVLDRDGLPDFQALQRAFDEHSDAQIVYYLFDAPWLNGDDLRKQPLQARREALAQVLEGQRSKLIRFSAGFAASHHDIVESARAMGLEGVIGKRAGSLYLGKRSADWIKLKCRLAQEFVIVGYTPPEGSRSGFGALLLAVNDARAAGLVYAGRVGSGFDGKTLRQLKQQLDALQRDSSPLCKPLSRELSRDVQWVEPQLVAEVQFAEWTRDAVLRQASFIGLRTDKPAAQVVREVARRAALPLVDEAQPDSSEQATKACVAGVAISHPERVIDPQSGVSKAVLAQFYLAIADRLLAELSKRPVALLRCPQGIEGEQFFQKHAQRLSIPNITQLDASLDPGHAPLLQIDNRAALAGVVQMGGIELHTWGATSDRIETPDRLIFDLDPDPALPWCSMIEATQMLLAVLDELGLQAFLKTSGGKGMHLIVPLARHTGWDQVKRFGKAVAEFMSRQLPERFSATAGPQNRVGRIFIDYLRNTRGGTTVSAWSVRARPGLPVSVPVGRDELATLSSARQWHVGNLAERLRDLDEDPWAGYHNRQRITQAMWRQLGIDD